MSEVAASENKPVAKTPAGVQPIKFSQTKADITKMAIKYKKIPDVTTKEGYEKAQQAKRDLTPMRTAITKEMGLQKESAQTHIKNINKKGGALVDLIIAIEKPIYDAKKAQDDKVAADKAAEVLKEKHRIDDIQDLIAEIDGMTGGLLGADTKTVEDRLAEAEKITITADVYMEFVEPASIALAHIKDQLRSAVESAKAIADQKKSLDTQQENLDKQKKIDDDARLKTESDQKKIDDDKQAEFDAREKVIDTKNMITEIKGAPIELMDAALIDLESKLEEIKRIEVDDSYGDLENDVREAIDSTIIKLNMMIDNQKIADEKAEEQLKKDNEEALASRMPEDQKLRAYGDSLAAVNVPFIDDTALLTIQSRAVTMVEDIVKFINSNTQDSE